MTASLDKVLADARSVAQGATKEQRAIRRIGPDDPTPSGGAVVVRQYNGYDASLKDVEATIAAAGVDDPTIYLLVPALEADALSKALQTKAAAESVLSQRGLAATDDGRQAREAMMARARQAGAEANAIIDQATKQTRIELAGGAVVEGTTPAAALKTAADRAVQRLYDKFDEGDNANWGSAFPTCLRGWSSLRLLRAAPPPAQQPPWFPAWTMLVPRRATLGCWLWPSTGTTGKPCCLFGRTMPPRLRHGRDPSPCFVVLSTTAPMTRLPD